MYLSRMPDWLKRLMPPGKWTMPLMGDPAVYLTFDDGPHPVATPFALDELKKYNARATFFCVGENVMAYPEIYTRILDEGHLVGNHTHNHLDGWRQQAEPYMKNVSRAAEYISSSLFRPPYGRIRRTQAQLLRESGYELIYWSLLSGDFDARLNPEHCLKRLKKRLKPGDIVVFHDSRKAWPRLSHILPRILEWCGEKQWENRTIGNFKK